MQTMLCFSHLPWNFVYQRPQHLMSRFAKIYRLFYFEEPRAGTQDYYVQAERGDIHVVQLYLSEEGGDRKARARRLVDDVLKKNRILQFSCWYYTPMALEHTEHLQPITTVYDSMDELSAFRFAPPQLLQRENELFSKSDIVFTGDYTLYQAKKGRHHNIHPFPSSIDKSHFGKARARHIDPEDQEHIPHPRLGFYGVIDERFDIALLKAVSGLRPEWHFVMIGPVVKIDEADLPQTPNIHYLGSKDYAELPRYISQWDIALILFALNESTAFISPTKTPEYLAAGLPVISTPIKDVVVPYGEAKLVHIAADANSLVAQAQEALGDRSYRAWLADVDEFLKDKSWDDTFEKMNNLIEKLKN